MASSLAVIGCALVGVLLVSELVSVPLAVLVS